MEAYIVEKPFLAADGTMATNGDNIQLTSRQAKYLLLSGKIKRKKKQTRKKTEVTDA
ncbi:MAG: hypothetical protein J7K75_08455 [Desulfuromonas sp.]|nr:hypothetical protein [Desulfuromonas sp.]